MIGQAQDNLWYKIVPIMLDLSYDWSNNFIILYFEIYETITKTYVEKKIYNTIERSNQGL